MNYRRFGKTDLFLSETGFGAWAIGGAAKVGDLPIGWGQTDDNESITALHTAFNQGINFYDTADFYGLGHSETLIGKVFGNSSDVIIATKVGQKPGMDRPVEIDYDRQYIVKACELSLQRLQRGHIDYYQLHVANLQHLQQGDCIQAMSDLQQQGKIRYWGISLSTYNPFPEAAYMLQNGFGHGFQLAFNIINQRALPLISEMFENGYGIIARMPLQFGLLSGKFSSSSKFEDTDHRSFRLTPEIIETANKLLAEIWPIASNYNISKAHLALSFILSFPEISTIIPGIRTDRQAIDNSAPPVALLPEERNCITALYLNGFESLLNQMQKQG
ncbi:MAG: aldo/keto reductase [Chitinophagaceae bacterium]